MDDAAAIKYYRGIYSLGADKQTQGSIMHTEIILVRHGATAANKENRFAGRTGENLHPDGRRQIAEMAEKLRYGAIEGLFCAPTARARESASILGETLGLTAQVLDGFHEIMISHWDGLTKEAIRARFGDEYPTWLDRPEAFAVPGCETIADVQQRAVAGTEALFGDFPGKRLLVVSHLIVIRALVLHYRGRPIADFRGIKIDNASLTRLIRRSDGATLVEA